MLARVEMEVPLIPVNTAMNPSQLLPSWSLTAAKDLTTQSRGIRLKSTNAFFAIANTTVTRYNSFVVGVDLTCR